MKDLAEFIVSKIIPDGGYKIDESDQDGKVLIDIKAPSSTLGLIIGKGGNTIKAIQTLLRVRGRLENKLVNVSVSEE